LRDRQAPKRRGGVGSTRHPTKKEKRGKVVDTRGMGKRGGKSDATEKRSANSYFQRKKKKKIRIAPPRRSKGGTRLKGGGEKEKRKKIKMPGARLMFQKEKSNSRINSQRERKKKNANKGGRERCLTVQGKGKKS